MKRSDIQSELQQAFNRRAANGGTIVAWHDPEGEFESMLDELDLPGIEVLKEQDNHMFELKCALNGELSGRNILLYRKRARALEGDWLADIEMRAEQFSADYLSIQLREIGAEDTPDMRGALSAHKKFFSKKRNVKRLSTLGAGFAAPQQLEIAMIAAVMNAASTDPADILITWLLSEADQDIADTLRDYGLFDAMTRLVQVCIGYEGDIEDYSALLQHVLLSCIVPHMPQKTMEGLKPCFDAGAARFCNNLFETWYRMGDGAEATSLYEACITVEDICGLPSVFSEVPTANLIECDTFPCIDAVILQRLMTEVADGSGDYQRVLADIAMRKSCCWYKRFDVFYRGVIAAARMQEFHRACNGVIEAGSAAEIWQAYTSSYASVDRWYRDFNEALSLAHTHSVYTLDDALKDCATAVENLYKNWFLHNLSKRWLDSCANDFTQTGWVPEVPRQLNFTMAEVDPMTNATKRAWVIISDALRYEVAQELEEVIQRETRCSCELDAMQSVFPSITKCGMSALLPAGSFQYTAGATGMEVLVDGVEAVSTTARQDILSSHYPGAVAVKYDDFINKLTAKERTAMVSDAPVVYVYHNTIDALGDKPETESKTFDACRTAIQELKALVERLVREQKATNIVITADHGFLYTANPIHEHESASVTEITGDVVEQGRRYAVARQGASSGIFFDVALPSDDLVGFCPRECVRIKLGGGGNNFVHGGLTLQECCVPVLRCSVKRKGARGYVETVPASISLITELGTITNGMFGVDILQDAPVSATTAPTTYEVFVGDAAHTPVTNIATVVADRADEDARVRTTHLQFTIKPGVDTDDQASYALYARNVDTKQIESLRTLKISIAFAPMDFGF